MELAWKNKQTNKLNTILMQKNRNNFSREIISWLPRTSERSRVHCDMRIVPFSFSFWSFWFDLYLSHTHTQCVLHTHTHTPNSILSIHLIKYKVQASLESKPTLSAWTVEQIKVRSTFNYAVSYLCVHRGGELKFSLKKKKVIQFKWKAI